MPSVSTYLTVLSQSDKDDYTSSELQAILNFIHKNGKPAEYTQAVKYISQLKEKVEKKEEKVKEMVAIKPIEIKGDVQTKPIEPKDLMESDEEEEEAFVKSKTEEKSVSPSVEPSIAPSEVPSVMSVTPSPLKRELTIPFAPKKKKKKKKNNKGGLHRVTCSICKSSVKYPKRKAHRESIKHQNAIKTLEEQKIQLLAEKLMEEKLKVLNESD